MSSTPSTGFLCPIWQQVCLREGCVGYKSHTKESFRDTKLERFVPIDDLSFYRSLSQDELDERFERVVSVTRECKLLGTLIDQEETVDHLVPSTTKNYYV